MYPNMFRNGLKTLGCLGVIILTVVSAAVLVLAVVSVVLWQEGRRR